MRDTIAQTRFKNISKLSNDPLLAKGNTLRSGEDSLKLKELMELCTNLQRRVLDLEKTKTTKQNEITSLKRRVKKLEQKKRSRNHRLKRLHKVDITMVNVQDDAEMFDVNTLTGDVVFIEQEVAAKHVNLTIDEVTLAQALTYLKSVKPKVKGVGIQEPSTTTTKTTNSSQQPSQDNGKGIMVEEPVKTMKKKDLIRIDEEIAKRLQAKFDEEERLAREKDEANKMFDRAFKRVNTFVDFKTDLVEGSSKRAGEELEQESTKKQKVDEDKDTAELQSLMEVIPDEEEVAIDVVPLATKPPTIVDWKIHKEGKKSYYQIVRADGKSQIYRVISLMLKSFSREDLQDLYKLVKAKYKSTRPVEDLDLVLWSDLKTIALLELAIWNDLHAGRKEISPYTTYNYRYAEQEALVFKTAGEVTTASTKLLLLEEVTTASGINAAEGVNAASEEVSTAELVSTAYVIKYSLTFDELMATPIDFTKIAMKRLKLDKITKADLVGSVYKLLKGTCKSSIELEYNMDQCYNGLTNKLDWTNPERDKYLYDLNKPLPLQGAPSHLTIPSPIKVAYNKDVALEISHWGPKRQLFYMSQINRFSKHDVFSTMKILSVVSVKVDKQYGYGYLEEIVVRRADRKLYTFKECDFPKLHLNDIEDMLLLHVQNKLFNLEGDDIVDLAVALHETLKSIREILHYRLLNFKLGYNIDIPKRKWTEKDQNRIDIMVQLIDKQLLERTIMQNLEILVGGRELETDYRLMMWIV
ncbi:hypothetical protein Tco_1101701 [Tanacetum coccineum]